MFTGLIEEIGEIAKVKSISKGKLFKIKCGEILSDLKVDDSVAVNGICLTATKVNTDSFEASAVEETLTRTTLNFFNAGNKVNLERAMTLNDRLGGHLVAGHVDCVGYITSIQKRGVSFWVEIEIPLTITKYIIEKGSIAINGISLTVANIKNHKLAVAVIPHTYEMTTLNMLANNSPVNVEVDMIGKYVEKMMSYKNNSELTIDKLKKMGY